MTREDLSRFLEDLARNELLFPILDLRGNVLKTFCNLAAKRKLPGENFKEFDAPNLMADDMGRIMRDNKSGLWRTMSGAEAALWAINGRRAMGFMSCAQMSEDHAHIVWIYPKEMNLSGSLKKLVPWCANIGKGNPSEPLRSISFKESTRPNWICKTSQAFPVATGEALYYGFTG